MPIVVSNTRFPLVVVTMTGEMTDADLAAYHDDVRTSMLRAKTEGVKCGVVIDGSEAGPPTAKQRRAMAEFLAANDALIQGHVAASALVIASPIQRAIVTAIGWLRPLPMSCRPVATLEAAHDWVRGGLARASRSQTG